MGTDLEVGIRMEVAGLRDRGARQRGAADLAVRLDPAGKQRREAGLESDGKKTSVRGERSQFQLPSENPDEFPSVAAFEEQKYHELPARFFREIVRRTAFATDNESSRYALGGVLLELARRDDHGGGHRRTAAGQAGGPGQVGRRSRDRRQQHDRADPGDAGVRTGPGRQRREYPVGRPRQRRAGHAAAGRRSTAGWSKAASPVARRVSPATRASAKIEMTVGPFHAAVRQAAIVTSEERRGVDFTFGDGKVVLAGHGAELGESHIELPIAYDGPGSSGQPRSSLRERFSQGSRSRANLRPGAPDAESAAVCRPTTATAT